MKTGTIGHVAHGKSTLVKAISGVQYAITILNEFTKISLLSQMFKVRILKEWIISNIKKKMMQNYKNGKKNMTLLGNYLKYSFWEMFLI